MKREDRRAALLQAAEELIDERGIGAFGFEALAEAAGVAKTLPYAYFESKDEVLLALFDRVIGGLDAEVEAVARSGGSFEEVVRGSLEVWFDAVRDEGRLLAGLLDGRAVPGLAPAIRRRDRASHKLWHDVVVEHLGLGDPSAHVLAAILNESATGVVQLWVARRGSRAELVETFVLATLGAAAALREG
jgi:AcrR family transcriptional regulator